VEEQHRNPLVPQSVSHVVVLLSARDAMQKKYSRDLGLPDEASTEQEQAMAIDEARTRGFSLHPHVAAYGVGGFKGLIGGPRESAARECSSGQRVPRQQTEF